MFAHVRFQHQVKVNPFCFVSLVLSAKLRFFGESMTITRKYRRKFLLEIYKLLEPQQVVTESPSVLNLLGSGCVLLEFPSISEATREIQHLLSNFSCI